MNRNTLYLIAAVVVGGLIFFAGYKSKNCPQAPDTSHLSQLADSLQVRVDSLELFIKSQDGKLPGDTPIKPKVDAKKRSFSTLSDRAKLDTLTKRLQSDLPDTRRVQE